MIVRLPMNTQSCREHRSRSEYASLCGICSNSRRSFFAVFRPSSEAEVSNRSSNSPFVNSSQLRSTRNRPFLASSSTKAFDSTSRRCAPNLVSELPIVVEANWANGVARISGNFAYPLWNPFPFSFIVYSLNATAVATLVHQAGVESVVGFNQ